MRIVKIDFKAENKLPDGKCLGRKGEHNATELNITLPSEMLNNAEVKGIVIVFQVGAHKVFHSDVHEKAETINYKLPREVTCANSVEVQLEGFDSDEELIIKSEVVDGLYFEPSVCGEDANNEVGKSLVGEIAANTLARHTHRNAEVLDKLGESEGSLTYDGKVIGGSVARATAQKEFTQDDMNYMFFPEIVGSGKYFFLTLVEEDGDIPVGTEIADLEIACDGIADGEYVSIREMFGVDEKPYMILNDKVYINEIRGIVVVAVYFPIGLNSIATKAANYEWTSARITYYT